MGSTLAEYADKECIRKIIKEIEKEIDGLPDKIENSVFELLYEQSPEYCMSFIEDNTKQIQKMLDDMYLKYSKILVRKLYIVKQFLL